MSASAFCRNVTLLQVVQAPRNISLSLCLVGAGNTCACWAAGLDIRQGGSLIVIEWSLACAASGHTCAKPLADLGIKGLLRCFASESEAAAWR